MYRTPIRNLVVKISSREGKLLNKIKAIFKNDAFIPDAAVFPEIDKDRIAREMNLRKEGAARGRKAQPPTDVDRPDHVEVDIISRVEALRRRGLDNYESNRQVYSERLNSAGAARQRVQTDAKDAITRFNAETRAWRDMMVEPRERVQEAYRWRNTFRKQNNLERPAEKASSITNIVFIGLLMVAIESVFNAYLFASSNPLGLFGGLMAAMLVSLGNVIISTLLGMWSRLINISGGWRTGLKVFGAIFFLAWLGFAVSYNLAVAHFRDAAESGQGWREAGISAMLTLTEHTTRLHTMESYILLILGFIISILAFLKGWHSSDPYPGYSRVQKNVIDARNKYISMLNEAIEKLEVHRDDAVADLEASREEVQRNINDSVDALYGQRTLTSGVAPFLEQCNIAANYLLAVYRDANRANRPDSSPAPEHFASEHNFEPFTPAKVEEFQREDAENQLKQIQELVAEATDSIFTTFNDAVHDHYEIDELEGVDSDKARILTGNRKGRSDASELQVISRHDGAA